MVEQRPFKALVASSSLAQPTVGFTLERYENRGDPPLFPSRARRRGKARKKARSIGNFSARSLRFVPVRSWGYGYRRIADPSATNVPTNLDRIAQFQFLLKIAPPP